MGYARKHGAACKQTRTDQVRQRLEEEILANLHAPGTRLDEAEQSARLGCSRTPLREAFNQLVAVGLLVRRSHCGVFVAPRDHSGTAEVLEAYVEIEALCASLAARRMPLAERAFLERVGSDDGRLRGVIRQACGNEVLAGFAETLEARLGAMPSMMGDSAKGDGHPGAVDALVRAMVMGDGDAAAKAVREGLLSSLRPPSRSAAA